MGTVFISENACNSLINALSDAGHEIYTVKSSDVVYPAISSHPDIYMCPVSDTLLIDETVQTDPPLRDLYIEELESQIDDIIEKPIIPAITPDGRGHIVFEMGNIGYEYPFDVPYNALSTGRFFIHNTELTAPALLDRARYAGLHIINVKQGYTKCSCVPVGNNAVITSDEGIARTLEAYSEMVQAEPHTPEDLIDVLLIRKGHVILEGFEYGFIGGTSGAIDGRIYFNGNLAAHPDFQAIYDFITARGLEPVWFEDEPLTDIGSIIWLP